MMSQCEMILSHLRRLGPITPLEALDMYGCFRLGARIADLRSEGHDIITRIVDRNGKKFAQYVLIEKEA